MRNKRLIIAMLAVAYAQTSLAGRIHDLAGRGEIGAFRAWLDGHPSELESLDEDRRTPLLIAAMYGDLDMARLLLDRRANPNAADREGRTPLLMAAYRGRLEMARLLLDRGADPNAANRYGKTPLIWAAANGNLEMVRLLLDRRANPNAADKYGQTPLFRAAAGGHLDLVRELVARGALVTDVVRAAAQDEATRALLSPEGIARLHRAVAEGHAAAGRHTAAARSFAQAGDHGAAAGSYQAAAKQSLDLKKVNTATKKYQGMFRSLAALAQTPGITAARLDEIAADLARKEAEARVALESENNRFDNALAGSEAKAGTIEVQLAAAAGDAVRTRVLTSKMAALLRKQKISKKKLEQGMAGLDILAAEAAAVHEAIATARAALPAP